MNEQQKTPDILVEQLALKELPKDKEELVRRQLHQAQEERLLKEIEKSNEEILRQYPSAQMAAKISKRAGDDYKKRESTKKRLMVAIPAVAGTALAVFLALALLSNPSSVTSTQEVDQIIWSVPGPEKITMKWGGKNLKVVRKKGPDDEELKNKAQVSEGDVLQIKYFAGTAPFGVIFSMDGRGETTLHFPSDSKDSTALERGKLRALPFSYTLDDAPEFERFFFVVSSEAIDVEAILEAGKKLGAQKEEPLELPQNADVIEELILLKK